MKKYLKIILTIIISVLILVPVKADETNNRQPRAGNF